MAGSIVVDAGFVTALLSRRDTNHAWAKGQAPRLALPWLTCDAALAEAFHLLGPRGGPALVTLLRRGALMPAFVLGPEMESVLRLMTKHSDQPMSLADACLVRMTEILPDPLLVTTDTDFQVYRRHGRQVVPCLMPG